jgi:thiosulfate/3-mercaptopyruvate sulfurtransferase
MMIAAAILLATLQGPGDPMLVTAAWLAQHQRDANLVLFQVGPRAAYDSAHIAGAHYMPFESFSAPRDSMRPALELPSPAFFDSVLESKGVSDDSRIVIYSSDQWFSPTTRLYLTLTWAGLGARTSILDGGIEAWRTAHGVVTNAAPAPGHGSLTLHPRSDVIVTTDWVRAHLQDPTIALVDARDTPFYLGTFAGRPQAGRQGHIPGAYSIPFGDVVDSTGHMLSRTALETLFTSVRAASGDTVVTYCHIGQQGSLVWFAAKLAGFNARLYDDSFTEWNKSAQNPIERL